MNPFNNYGSNERVIQTSQPILPHLGAVIGEQRLHMPGCYARLLEDTTFIYAASDEAEQEISFSFAGLSKGMYGQSDKLFNGMYQNKGLFYWSIYGWVNISVYDYSNRIISGTFQFLGKRTCTNDIKIISEGFFTNLPF